MGEIKIQIRRVEMAKHMTIKKCIFCESNNLDLICEYSINSDRADKGHWCIKCNECKSQGSKDKILDNALARWNRETQHLTTTQEKTLFD